MVASWRGLEVGNTRKNFNREYVEGEVKLDNPNLDQPKWWLAGLIDN